MPSQPQTQPSLSNTLLTYPSPQNTIALLHARDSKLTDLGIFLNIDQLFFKTSATASFNSKCFEDISVDPAFIRATEAEALCKAVAETEAIRLETLRRAADKEEIRRTTDAAVITCTAQDDPRTEEAEALLREKIYGIRHTEEDMFRTLGNDALSFADGDADKPLMSIGVLPAAFVFSQPFSLGEPRSDHRL